MHLPVRRSTAALTALFVATLTLYLLVRPAPVDGTSSQVPTQRQPLSEPRDTPAPDESAEPEEEPSSQATPPEDEPAPTVTDEETTPAPEPSNAEPTAEPVPTAPGSPTTSEPAAPSPDAATGEPSGDELPAGR